MITTLQDLVDSARAGFDGVDHDCLLVFFDERQNSFYFSRSLLTDVPCVSNTFSRILLDCKARFRGVDFRDLVVVWSGSGIDVKRKNSK